jgi:hypothetical protein
MKLNRSAETLEAANRVLGIVSGRTPSNDTRVSVTPDRTLWAVGAACGLSEGEIILIPRLEGDSFGEGWDKAEAETVIAWVEENFREYEIHCPYPFFTSMIHWNDETRTPAKRIPGVSISTQEGHGRDFYKDGTEYDWDGAGLEANQPELLEQARAIAARAFQ